MPGGFDIWHHIRGQIDTTAASVGRISIPRFSTRAQRARRLWRSGPLPGQAEIDELPRKGLRSVVAHQDGTKLRDWILQFRALNQPMICTGLGRTLGTYSRFGKSWRVSSCSGHHKGLPADPWAPWNAQFAYGDVTMATTILCPCAAT